MRLGACCVIVKWARPIPLGVRVFGIRDSYKGVIVSQPAGSPLFIHCDDGDTLTMQQLASQIGCSTDEIGDHLTLIGDMAGLPAGSTLSQVSMPDSSADGHEPARSQHTGARLVAVDAEQPAVPSVTLAGDAAMQGPEQASAHMTVKLVVHADGSIQLLTQIQDGQQQEEELQESCPLKVLVAVEADEVVRMGDEAAQMEKQHGELQGKERERKKDVKWARDGNRYRDADRGREREVMGGEVQTAAASTGGTCAPRRTSFMQQLAAAMRPGGSQKGPSQQSMSAKRLPSSTASADITSDAANHRPHLARNGADQAAADVVCTNGGDGSAQVLQPTAGNAGSQPSAVAALPTDGASASKDNGSAIIVEASVGMVDSAGCTAVQAATSVTHSIGSGDAQHHNAVAASQHDVATAQAGLGLQVAAEQACMAHDEMRPDQQQPPVNRDHALPVSSAMQRERLVDLVDRLAAAHELETGPVDINAAGSAMQLPQQELPDSLNMHMDISNNAPDTAGGGQNNGTSPLLNVGIMAGRHDCQQQMRQAAMTAGSAALLSSSSNDGDDDCCYLGVQKCSPGKWSASARINQKAIFLGMYTTAEEAARAYDDAVRGYHGAQAKLNFPGPTKQGRKFLGIRQTRSGKWAATTKFNGQHIALGTHSTPEMAAQAYDVAARQLRGERAKLNFPTLEEQETRHLLPAIHQIADLTLAAHDGTPGTPSQHAGVRQLECLPPTTNAPSQQMFISSRQGPSAQHGWLMQEHNDSSSGQHNLGFPAPWLSVYVYASTDEGRTHVKWENAHEMLMTEAGKHLRPLFHTDKLAALPAAFNEQHNTAKGGDWRQQLMLAQHMRVGKRWLPAGTSLTEVFDAAAAAAQEVDITPPYARQPITLATQIQSILAALPGSTQQHSSQPFTTNYLQPQHTGGTAPHPLNSHVQAALDLTGKNAERRARLLRPMRARRSASVVAVHISPQRTSKRQKVTPKHWPEFAVGDVPLEDGTGAGWHVANLPPLTTRLKSPSIALHRDSGVKIAHDIPPLNTASRCVLSPIDFHGTAQMTSSPAAAAAGGGAAAAGHGLVTAIRPRLLPSARKYQSSSSNGSRNASEDDGTGSTDDDESGHPHSFQTQEALFTAQQGLQDAQQPAHKRVKVAALSPVSSAFQSARIIAPAAAQQLMARHDVQQHAAAVQVQPPAPFSIATLPRSLFAGHPQQLSPLPSLQLYGDRLPFNAKPVILTALCKLLRELGCAHCGTDLLQQLRQRIKDVNETSEATVVVSYQLLQEAVAAHDLQAVLQWLWAGFGLQLNVQQ